MKTKQTNIKAKLPKKVMDMGGKKWHCQDKETIKKIVIVDKTTEKRVLECIVSMGRSKGASSVYCDLSIYDVKDSKLKDCEWLYDYGYDDEPNPRKTTSLDGHGVAGGYGYDKESAAIGAAISDTGITLWGTPYHSQVPDFKKQAHIGGTGCHESALLAIAYACGYNNVIMVG